MKNRKEILHPEAEAHINNLETGLKFCIGLLDQYLKPDKEVPTGLPPMFYITCDEATDKALIEDYKKIKELLNTPR